MTRITDEAVEAAAIKLHPTLWDGQPGYRHAESARADARERVRVVLEAALPHLEGATPAIDREALLQVVAEYIDDLDAVPPMGTSAEHLERRAVHVTDAVIAHLGGGAS